MNANEIIREAMKLKGYNQAILAKDAGLKRHSNVSELLRSRSMRLDNFLLLLNTMNYDVVVVDRNKSHGSQTKWVVNRTGDSCSQNDEVEQ